ncbi:hypothetical protein A374_11890 [Fictibacillus macauensis ZFHKF-1]|uniref:DUF881 domain-containing protein n=1 Tax=Fictibacillus macauensis ZFHKF-1 TaxID=1196324 RepID=I8UDX8_9BACL|nr:DUF881 domain-containing protein [Fictibacillus macauensis]EIT84998.1 hypothetical protein A374_11890 [Fictibacillus macauensis ZFHKF-1]
MSGKPRKKIALFSVITLITGFILAYSYQYTKQESEKHPSVKEWQQEDQLRNDLLHVQRINHSLTDRLQHVRVQAQAEENKLVHEKKQSHYVVEELNRLRKVVGGVKVKGEGLEVSLKDTTFIPQSSDPNQYIVHEQHIRAVIYELLVSGAEAVAVNGQRITSHSYVTCIGPVVSIDGHQFPAPFIVSAIGNKNTLEKALRLSLLPQLEEDGIKVQLFGRDDITMDAHLHNEG